MCNFKYPYSLLDICYTYISSSNTADTCLLSRIKAYMAVWTIGNSGSVHSPLCGIGPIQFKRKSVSHIVIAKVKEFKTVILA